MAMAASTLARRALSASKSTPRAVLSPAPSCSSSSHVVKRSFTASAPALARRTKTVMEENLTEDDFFTLLTEQSSIDDSPSFGHHILMEKRRVLHYFRLIEHEMPKLVAYRKPFIPPNSKETPLFIKSVDYQGEAHPATARRSVVVAVDDLPLATSSSPDAPNDPEVVNTIKLLAGPRWTPNPPKDAGVMEEEAWGNGYIKISCDTYGSGEKNLKWVSDALDRLVEQAKVSKKDFADMPVDMRHVFAKVRKAKKGDHRRDRPLRPVSVKDFPKEWLPTTEKLLA